MDSGGTTENGANFVQNFLAVLMAEKFDDGKSDRKVSFAAEAMRAAIKISPAPMVLPPRWNRRLPGAVVTQPSPSAGRH
jgi:hypothetical protein